MEREDAFVRVAVVQAAPVLFDREATVKKGLPAHPRGCGSRGAVDPVP
jgi:hypothetical protein